MTPSDDSGTVAIDVHEPSLIDARAQQRHLAAIDTAVATLVAAVVVVTDIVRGDSGARPVAIPLGLAAAAVLVLRRRYPGWVLAASGGLVLVLYHVDRSAASIAVLAPAVALYSVALRRGRLEQLAGGVAAVGAVIVADVTHPGSPTIGQTIGHALLVAVPLLAAEVIRTHQANLRLLVERLELAEQARERAAEQRAGEERMRIARELHDVVAHTLTAINVQAGAAAERLDPGEARDALERIEATSHAAIGELRTIVGVLRGPETADAPRAPTPGLPDIADLVARAHDQGLDVALQMAGSPPASVSEPTSLAAYRIVQESLTNVRRHAPGAAVTVRLRFDPAGVAITVDNGRCGSPPAAGAGSAESANGGVGIIGMRERATAVGGQLDAAPTDGGFRVRAELPYAPVR